MVPRKFQASVLVQRMAGRDGGFFDASVQGGRGLCRAAAVHYIYPIIDARRNLGKGSTGDDAMILASKSLISTGKIYDFIIDFKTPISPGPAWVIFNSPFSFFDLYFLFG